MEELSLTTKASSSSSPPPPNSHGGWWDEAKRMVDLAVPSTLVKIGIQVPPMIITAMVGKRFGSHYLGGFALANLVVNLCIVAVLQGLLMASDTLGPQAYGVNNKRQVGILAIRGAVVCLVCIMPLSTVVRMHLEELLLWMGQPLLASKYAEQFYRVIQWGIPFNVLYFVGWKFLSAQGKMRPLIYVTIVSMLVVLPLSLHFFLNAFGPVGAAWSWTCLQASQCVLLSGHLVWFQPHDKHTWEGLSVWREALDWKEIKVFLSLGFGGVLSLNEWFFWENMTLMAGHLGTLPLSIFTITSMVGVGVCMIPIGMAYALCIRIGNVIARDHQYAQRLMLVCFSIFAATNGLIAVSVYCWRLQIIGMFTSDPAVIEVSDRQREGAESNEC